jgi:hypothetical protein
MLATTVPTMDYLIPVMHALWKELLRIESGFYIVKGLLHYIEGENFSIEEGEIIFATEED